MGLPAGDNVSAYSTAYRALRRCYPGGSISRRRRRLLEQTQWLAPGELEAWQLEGLRRIVRHAYEHVPFYRELYTREQVHPSDVRTIRDFQALPFLTRDHVREHLERLVAPALRSRALPNSTGGSTGQPMRFYTERAFDWWDPALELRGRGWYGVREGDRTAFVWGAQRDLHVQHRRARLKAAIQRERYLNAFQMTEADMQAFAEMLVRWRPAMLRAYASALCLFAEYVRERGITGIRPRLIETTAEKVFPAQRELLEEVFGCPVADWYSAREFGTIGFQCPAGSLHVCETRYLEVVAGDRVVAPGEMGEVVITSLHQEAMPLIRYKIGDMAVSASGPCSCGRGLPVLGEVVGRLQDFLVATNGCFVHGGYFPHTLRAWPQIVKYQVYQPDRHRLEVRLVAGGGDDAQWIDRLADELHGCFGLEMQIDIRLVDEIPLTAAGKHRFIVSDVVPRFDCEWTCAPGTDGSTT